MAKKQIILALYTLMLTAHPFTISLRNQTSEPIRTWARPSHHACLHLLWQKIAPGATITTDCDLTPSFYAAITFYPMQIYPQYITLALPAWGQGAYPNYRLIGCNATPYQCQTEVHEKGLTFTLRNR